MNGVQTPWPEAGWNGAGRGMRRSIVFCARGQEPWPDVTESLRRRGFESAEVCLGAGGFEGFEGSEPDLVVVGPASTRSWDGLELARQIRQAHPSVPILLLGPGVSEEQAAAACDSAIDAFFRCRSCPEEPVYPAAPLVNGSCIVGDSPPMRQIKAYIGLVAGTDSNVLITGETGTGKDLVAQLIHANSPRRDKAFVCINSAALPDSLLESELFGYERGAFTGAYASFEGKLKLGDRGTLFFDEVGEMTPSAQAKILRAIETREFQRLGGRRSVALDVRIIAATNQDLERLMKEGRFRKDLYYRLHVATIHLPPLRGRTADIADLLKHYLRQFNERFRTQVEGLTQEAFELLLRYDWPGNVRELKNLLEAIFVCGPGRRITIMDLPQSLRQRFSVSEPVPGDDQERLLAALLSTNWNKSRAARELRWSRMTLYRKLAKYGMAKENGVRAKAAGA